MPNSRWFPNRNDLLTHEVEDDLILYDPHTGGVVCLNLVAGLVWDLCDGSRDSSAIATAIANMFQKPLDDVAPDVEAILAQFFERGLIH